jgi:hypothetical protein
MRKTLEDALYAAYPSFFRRKDLPESGMSRGIECWGGWYAIVDGLCLVLSTHTRQSGNPPTEATKRVARSPLRGTDGGFCVSRSKPFTNTYDQPSWLLT